MAKQGRRPRRQSSQQRKQQQQQQRDQANRLRFVGPAGVEASDLPDKGRDVVDTDLEKEPVRDVPQHHGIGPFDQVGMRGHTDIVQAKARGGRKRN
jgi:hypothetical protein